VVLHHYVDKVLMVGGSITARFGGFEMHVRPEVHVNGDYSRRFGDSEIPVDGIVRTAVEAVFAEHVPQMPAGTVRILTSTDNTMGSHIRSSNWYTPRSYADLPELTHRLGNDTACAVAHWPPTPTEQLAAAVEGAVFDAARNATIVGLGTDVKVMVVRDEGHFSVTASVPVLASSVKSRVEYEATVQSVREMLLRRMGAEFPGVSLELLLNSNDQLEDHPFLVGFGSALELRDLGMTGRGNHLSGVISLFRPHSMECAFGKNPAYHTGKIYHHVADEVARDLVGEKSDFLSVLVYGRSSEPIESPAMIVAQGDVGRLNKSELRASFETSIHNFDQLLERMISYDWQSPSLLR